MKFLIPMPAGELITTDNVSPYVIASTIAVEDKDFYTNPGLIHWGIMRALWQNYTSGEVVSGASTITQQLAHPHCSRRKNAAR